MIIYSICICERAISVSPMYHILHLCCCILLSTIVKIITSRFGAKNIWVDYFKRKFIWNPIINTYHIYLH